MLHVVGGDGYYTFMVLYFYGIAGTCQGQEFSLADLCVESSEFSGTTCTVESILGKWQYESTLLDAETDLTILDTVRNDGSDNTR